MPAPITVSHEQVAKAAAQLSAEGSPITGWTLRRVIGAGRASRLAKVWQEQQGGDALAQALLEPEAPALPPAISEHLSAATERLSAELAGLVSQAWKAASDLATRRVQEEVDQARARVAALEADLARAEDVMEAADDMERILREETQELFTERQATYHEHLEKVAEVTREAMRARADADALRAGC